MAKVYILIFGPAFGTRDEVKAALTAENLAWRYELPSSFFIASDRSAKDISVALRKRLTEKAHVIAEIDSSNYWGRANEKTWYLFENKRLKP